IAVVRYREPAGAVGRLVVVDGVGREVSVVDLPAGTGEEQEATITLGDVSSGVYFLELRYGSERSALPLVVRQ
ncbi:MAG TPA: hypothetical protein VHI13_06245, partial [Candidatus Kapabacteria bacterium]|nr:hypothetical protein [Candidatus Kapabacteria bacterium]